MTKQDFANAILTLRQAARDLATQSHVIEQGAAEGAASTDVLHRMHVIFMRAEALATSASNLCHVIEDEVHQGQSH